MKTTASSTPSAAARRRRLRLQKPPPTSSTTAPGTWRRISGSARTSVSWPFRGTSRAAQRITWPSNQAEALAHGATVESRPEGGGVNSGDQPDHSLRSDGAERGGYGLPGAPAEEGHHVRLFTGPPDQSASTGCAGPPDLVSMGGRHRLGHAGFAPQAPRHQTERCRGAEPDAVARVRAGERRGTGGGAGCEKRHPGRIADHRERQGGVVHGCLRLGRGADDHRIAREAVGHDMHEGLDPALTGWEVVGNDEGAGHQAAFSLGSGRWRSVAASAGSAFSNGDGSGVRSRLAGCASTAD